ncbi:MAG: OmpH family outer membrane protein [Bacteroidales bacterium]|nr:OmpH family outer membrane protein [Bacteroidales bacterium]
MHKSILKRFVLSTVMIFAVSFMAQAQKFAYVDTDYILENIPEYSDAKAKLDQLTVEWQKEIEEKFAKVDEMYKEYQAEKPLLPDDIKRKRENEIVEKEKEAKELQKKRFGKEGDLYKKRQELIKPIQEKVYNAIEEVANDRNYAIIFDKAQNPNILFTDPRYDLSEDVLDKLGYTY